MVILIILLRITTTLGSLIKHYYLKFNLIRNNNKHENKFQMNQTTLESTNNETDFEPKLEKTEIVNKIETEETKIMTNEKQSEEVNFSLHNNENEEEDYSITSIHTREIQHSFLERLKIEIDAELNDYYEDIIQQIESSGQNEKSLLPSNLINDEKRERIDLIVRNLTQKINDVLKKSKLDLQNYFDRLFNEYSQPGTTFVSNVTKESIKMAALNQYCLFISNHILLKDLRINYPVGILCYSNYYLHAYQQAFLRNHFVIDDEMNWDKLTMNLIDMELFDFQYKKRHIGYHKENIFYLYKREIIEQLIMSSFKLTELEEKNYFYFFD